MSFYFRGSMYAIAYYYFSRYFFSVVTWLFLKSFVPFLHALTTLTDVLSCIYLVVIVECPNNFSPVCKVELC